MEEIIGKVLTKDLVPFILSFILDELNITGMDIKTLILALKQISCSGKGIEPKTFPTIRDVRIYINSYLHFPNDEDRRLVYYVKHGSEYLVRKLFQDKSIVFCEMIKNDNNMTEIFEEYVNYPYILSRALHYAKNEEKDDSIVKFVRSNILHNFVFLNKKTVGCFGNIFWHLEEEENYNKILKSGFYSQEDIHTRATNFIDSDIALNWLETQKIFLELIQDDKLKIEFVKKFNLID